MLCRDGAMDGKEGHLWKMHRKILGCDDPEKIVHRYRLRSPGARLFSFQRIANDRSRDVNELMAEFAELYVTPEVLAAANSDPEYEDKHMPKYVICRELRCGFKSVGALHGHLESQHDIKDIDKWRREHNWAPIIAPAAARKKAEELSDRNKKLRKRAWRPADWKDWPVWQKAVGMLIIENTSLEPREIGIHMDDSRTQFRWPEEWKYDSWERNFTKTGPGATWISKIRTKIRDELR
jgi:hypothetical protein